jgi:hypothetical protein
MSACAPRVKIPTDAAHAVFKTPLPIGSESAERWLAWFKIKQTQIEVVRDMGLIQLYKHQRIIKTSGRVVWCCQSNIVREEVQT